MEKHMKRQETHEFIAEGRFIELAANRKHIEREVRGAYAERLAKAGFFRRILIRLAMSREVRRRLEKVAPTDGLYSKT
jgi:hypothetical protein